MNVGIRSFLAGAVLFQLLPEEELDRLSRVVSQKAFQPEEKIYTEGEKARVTWVVRTGQIRIAKASLNGNPVTIELMSPGEIFGCAACTAAGFYPCEATADRPSTVISIPTREFLSLLERYNKFAGAVYMEMGQRLREAQKLRTLAVEPVEKRIAGALLWLQSKFGPVLPFTRQAVAEMTNTTEETAIRTLIQFRKRGLIHTARKKITLLKPQELSKLVEPR